MDLMDTLKAWHDATKEVEAAKSVIAREMGLRRQLMEMAFPNPKEGANKFTLPGNWVLKLTHKIDRKVDEAAIEDVIENMGKKFGIDGHLLLRYKPELNTKMFKELPEEQQIIFSEALIIKPSTPTMELVEPKQK